MNQSVVRKGNCNALKICGVVLKLAIVLGIFGADLGAGLDCMLIFYQRLCPRGEGPYGKQVPD